ncbi:PucR family transcriptional regulator [Agromyces aerolatus]|uniref:PucR family transcriptional regulator n=1 Tax=Agromyces sp. LY-1074 TaxID=3074080 RepID=UPI002857033D|nr:MULTISPECIES: helix-turn-helix domain-containing protein [unclassified Agromyces]MDR5701399.1 helix-turn-helix domain-containing protein [Agromyces sp. LY-1074]MDR5706812.1 helix-turn-helix domain-containing protein [Agromyces sp. LY-1358]
MSGKSIRLRYLYDLADSLSGLLAVPVEITDRSFQRVLLSDQDHSGAPLWRAISTPAAMARASNPAEAPRDIVRADGVSSLGIPGFTVIPLPAVDGHEPPEAYLWLIEVNGAIDPAYVEHARTIADRTFRALRAVPRPDDADLEGHVEERAALFESSPTELRARLEAIARAKGLRHVDRAYAVSILAQVRDEHYATIERLQDALRQLVSRVRERSLRRRAIAAAVEAEAVLLIASPEDVAGHDDAERVIAVLQDELFRLRGEDVTHTWTIGVSSLDLPWHMAAAAVRQARGAAAVGQRVGWQNARISWADAAPYQGMAELPPQLLRDSFVSPELARFLGDEEHRELAETLRSFLEHAGNVQAVASEKFLHRGTVYHRLKRIETLLGLDLADGNDRLTAHMGLLSWEIVHGAAPRA